jgi:hypothetical protein
MEEGLEECSKSVWSLVVGRRLSFRGGPGIHVGVVTPGQPDVGTLRKDRIVIVEPDWLRWLQKEQDETNALPPDSPWFSPD